MKNLNNLKNLLVAVYSFFDFRRLSELHFKSDWEKVKTITELMVALNGLMIILVFLVKPGFILSQRHDYDPARSEFILWTSLTFGFIYLLIRLLINFAKENELIIKPLLFVSVLCISVSTPLILAPNGIFDAVIWMIAFTFITVGLTIFSYQYMIFPIFFMLINFGVITFYHDYLPFKLRAYVLGDHSYLYELSKTELLTHLLILYTIILVTTTIVAFLTTKYQRREIHLRNIAEKDPLTGILNRRSILIFLNSEISKFEEHKTPLSLAMIDLDYFKKINDKYGHPFGDKALIHVAHEASRIIRSSDAIGRFGGEEFLLVFSNCSAKNAAEKINQLRNELAKKPLQFDDGTLIVIKLSAGVSQVTEHIQTGDALISEADKHLYQAKNKGRDRVVFPD